jgi:methylenetetrahydrofolate reductase (NADPH)
VIELKKCKDTASARQVGIEWAIQQSRELKDEGVPVIHFYTIGVSDNIRAIAREVF